MNIQKMIAVVALFFTAYITYELVSTSRDTAVNGTITKIDFPVKSAGTGNFRFNFSTEIPKVEIAFSHKGRFESFVTGYSPTVTLAHYNSHIRFRPFVLLPFLLLVAALGFTERLRRASDCF